MSNDFVLKKVSKEKKVMMVSAIIEGSYVTVYHDRKNGSLTLVISNLNRLGVVLFDKTINLCKEVMGTDEDAFCRYEIDCPVIEGSATVFEWRNNPKDVEGFLYMMANSNGFIKGGYTDLRLSNGRKISDYRNKAIRERLAVSNHTSSWSVPHAVYAMA